jgi:hypothetical protein
VRALTGATLGSLLVATAVVAHAQPAPLPPPPVAPPPPPAAPAPPAPPETPSDAATPPAAPETLETPYSDTPATPPPSTPPPADTGAIPLKPGTPIAPDTRPIRAQRRVALLGEIGWNGLAGFGAIVTYHAEPHISFDLGGGFSLLGWKAGARGRYNFSTDNFTPFVGVGFNATSGLGQFTSDPKNESNPEPGAQPFTLDVGPSYLMQGVVGFELVRKQGFTMQGALGYARLLNHDNTRLIDGSMTRDERTAMNIIFKSGPVISMAFGTSFK